MSQEYSVLELGIRKCIEKAGLLSLPQDNRDLLEEYGFDSLMKAMTVIELEREFNIHIKPDDLDTNSLETITDFLALVNQKLHQSIK